MRYLSYCLSTFASKQTCMLPNKKALHTVQSFVTSSGLFKKMIHFALALLKAIPRCARWSFLFVRICKHTCMLPNKKAPHIVQGFVTPSGLFKKMIHFALALLKAIPRCARWSFLFVRICKHTCMLPNKKAPHIVQGFVTPSGFKPETF